MENATDVFKIFSKYDVDSFIVNELYPKKIAETYSKNKLFIGWNSDGEKKYLDLSSSIVILIFGERGAGKSFVTRGVFNRLLESGHGVAIFDPQGEYHTSTKPVQKEFQHLLQEREVPKGFDNLKCYFPKFLVKYSPKKFSDHQLCQLSLKQINKYDLMTILGVDDENCPAGRAITSLFVDINEGRVQNFSQIREWLVWSIEQGIVASTTSRRLMSLIDNALNEGVLGSEFSGYSMGDDIAKNYCPILNLSGISSAGLAELSGYVSSTFSVNGTDILNKKKGNIIKKEKVFIITDEFHRFAPGDSNTSSRRFIRRLVKGERRTGISLIGVTHEPGGIDEEIVRHADYTLIPYNFDIPTAIKMIKSVSWKWSPKWYDQVYKTFNTMKKWSWLLIDKRNKTPDFTNKVSIRKQIITKVAGPLSHHSVEGE